MRLCSSIYNSVVPENPNYKDCLGAILFEYVKHIVGDKAPKVTEMIINLPIEDIKLIMQDWSLFNIRVLQAGEKLNQEQMPEKNNPIHTGKISQGFLE